MENQRQMFDSSKFIAEVASLALHFRPPRTKNGSMDAAVTAVTWTVAALYPAGVITHRFIRFEHGRKTSDL